MVFDFKVNRIIFVVGIILLFALNMFVLRQDGGLFTVIAVSLLFVIVISFIMRRVASQHYRQIHQLLFIDADARAYHDAVAKLAKKAPKKNQAFYAVKLQNLIMAAIFAGDYARAKVLRDEFKEISSEIPATQSSNRFSETLIDTLIPLFEGDQTLFSQNLAEVDKEVANLKPENREYVENNPYSIYYILKSIASVLNEDPLDEEKLKADLSEANEFMKSCVLKALENHDRVDQTFVGSFTFSEQNTMFYDEANSGDISE